jgi:hypothetical protein
MAKIRKRIISIGGDALTIEVEYDETPVRQDEDQFGDQPVFLVEKVIVKNNSGRQWYMLVKNGGEFRYEILIPDRLNATAVLNTAQRFELFNLSLSITSQQPG